MSDVAKLAGEIRRLKIVLAAARQSGESAIVKELEAEIKDVSTRWNTALVEEYKRTHGVSKPDVAPRKS